VARYVTETNTKTSRMDIWRSAEAVNGQMEKCRSCEWTNGLHMESKWVGGQVQMIKTSEELDGKLSSHFFSRKT
jgi:hypothetical protein